ncbi:hypothetical protein FRX31_020246 [Thalictrum thalictroides]|uniref:MULE transposase domain-containing protein n=1 Tax=Thalictrum thalictroides TaxID=46969 RepID=A0A7J6VZN3_THATH|nr:hypothetical protein FRX31_020246 [Thalictrum thalictroides]
MEPLVGRHPETLTILSDKQNRLINVVKQVFPGAHVRYCMRHIVANKKTRHKGLDSFAWVVSKSYKNALFRKNMKEPREEK